MPVKPIPEGYNTVTPYVLVHNVPRVIDFLKQAFDAKEVHPRMTRQDGAIMHAEVSVGNAKLMLGEPMGNYSPMPAMYYVYVPDTDATYRRALQAGAVSVMEPADQFYGDRNAGVRDPSGNLWWIATHIEDVAPEELERRHKAALTKAAG